MNWHSHKKDCKASQDRLIIYRAGATAQLAFFAFHEAVFDKNITNVKFEPDHITIHDGFYGEEELLFPFPHHHFSSPKDKQAMLAFSACSDALAFVEKVLLKMLPRMFSLPLITLLGALTKYSPHC